MANGVLAGLFGGQSPYPVDPQVQQGLLGDAGRSAGIALLANAMNPNIGQGLAAALAAGRQTYQGGAQEAYQVGRRQEQDKQFQQFREAQIQAQEALAEQRRQDAERERKESEAEAERIAGLGEQIQAMMEKMTPEERASFQRARLLGQLDLPADVVSSLSALPEDADPASWRPVPGMPGLVFNPEDPSQTLRIATPPAKPEEAPDEDNMAEVLAGIDSFGFPPAETAQLKALAQATGGNASQIGQMARSIAEELRKQKEIEEAQAEQDKPGAFGRLLGKLGGVLMQDVSVGDDDDRGAEEKTKTRSSVDSLVSSNPELQQGVDAMRRDGLPETEILKALKSMGYGG